MATVSIKNTFIDVPVSSNQETADDDIFVMSSLQAKRQSSAPAEHISGRERLGATFMPKDGRLTVPKLEEEDPWALQEPETEVEPLKMHAILNLTAKDAAPMAGNQGTPVDLSTTSPNFTRLASPFGRQETEMAWPTWDLAGGPIAGGEVATATDNVDMETVMMAMQAQLAAAGHFAFQAEGDAPQRLEKTGGSVSQRPSAEAVSMPGLNSSMPNPSAAWAGKTTAMMRNLPNKYTQSMLLEELNSAGFLGCFDFMYLPIDPETRANRGYAFINFSTPAYAWMFKLSFEGKKTSCFSTDSLKVVSVTPAALQGFDANYAHYSSARVNRGDPASRPLFLREPSNPVFAAKESRGCRGGRGRRRHGSLIDTAARAQLKGLPSQAFPNQPSQPPAAMSDAPSSSVPRFCPSCGGKREQHFLFCQFCGCNLKENKEGLQ